MNQKSEANPQKAPIGIGDSDDFDLPMPPPSLPTRSQQPTMAPDKISRDSAQQDKDWNADCHPLAETQPQGKIDLVKGANNASSPNRSKDTLAQQNGSAGSVGEEIPTTIDDHPIVAAVLIFLGIFATVLAIIEPFFLITLVPVYMIMVDFFRKKRLRMNLRQQSSRQSGNAS